MIVAMLDTNLCVRVIRERPAALAERFKVASDGFAVSTVVTYELFYGAAKSARPDHQRERVEDFLSRVQVLDFDEDASAHAGDIRADLERRGCLIGQYDLLIAGHARSRGLKLITGNLGEFRRVDGLRCEDWLVEGTA